MVSTQAKVKAVNGLLSTSWKSLGATVASGAGAVLVNAFPSLRVSGPVDAAIIAVAGLLTALHVHVPRFLAGGQPTGMENVLGDFGKLLENLGPKPPTTPKP